MLTVKAVDSLSSGSSPVTHPTAYAAPLGPPYCPVGLEDWCSHADTSVTAFAATPKSRTQEFHVFCHKNTHRNVTDILIILCSYFGGNYPASNSPLHCQTS